MISQVSNIVLTVKKDEAEYSFSMPVGAKLSDAHASCIEMLLVLKKSLDEMVEKAKEKTQKELDANSEIKEDDPITS